MKRQLPLDELVRRLAPVARPVMLRYFAPNCCIATCAILKRVFELYGYAAEAIPVTVMVFNERMVTMLEKGKGAPSTRPSGFTTVRPDQRIEHDRALWFKLTGAHGIGILPESAEVSRANGYEGYGGHLILRVRDLLVDASIAQASRPDKEIVVPMMVATTATEGFLHGQPLGVAIPSGALQYRRLPDVSYRTAPDWRDRARMVEPVAEIVRRLDEIDAAIKKGKQ